jgi:tetratricopeptide (TPR) repeat protein
VSGARYLLLLAVVTGAIAGCAQGPSAELAAWASDVDQRLVSAERQRAAGDLDGARATLAAAVASPVPEPDAPLALALRENLWFALGRVELEAGEPEAALSAAERGLRARAGGADVTVFTASLHALRALACEALGRPDDAIAAWEAAQAIHLRLYDRALAAPSEEPPR